LPPEERTAIRASEETYKARRRLGDFTTEQTLADQSECPAPNARGGSNQLPTWKPKDLTGKLQLQAVAAPPPSRWRWMNETLSPQVADALQQGLMITGARGSRRQGAGMSERPASRQEVIDSRDAKLRNPFNKNASEQYTQWLRYFSGMLSMLLFELREESRRLSEDMHAVVKGQAAVDPSDRAAQTEAMQTLGVRSIYVHKRMSEILSAQRRVSDGTYGYCRNAECCAQIENQRLSEWPAAEQCSACVKKQLGLETQEVGVIEQ
jgi:RNA polymerase-binding transcription factor DksA